MRTQTVRITVGLKRKFLKPFCVILLLFRGNVTTKNCAICKNLNFASLLRKIVFQTHNFGYTLMIMSLCRICFMNMLVLCNVH